MNDQKSCNVCCTTGGTFAGLAILAWFGVPAVFGVLSFLGVQIGALNPVFALVIVAALGLVSTGLYLGAKVHGRGEPFMVSVVGGVATVIGLFAAPAVAVFGLLVVAGSIGWNQLIVHRTRQHEQTL